MCHILCIYAPTSDGLAERKLFFQNVKHFYDSHPEVPRPHLMAGDFNDVEDMIDRLLMSQAPDSSIEDLDDLKLSLGLMITDGWHMTHHYKREYTFLRGSGQAATMSCLDRMYVPQGTSEFARCWRIDEPGVHTDHKLVSVELTTPSTSAIGKGRQVFPLHLLKNKSLAKQMKKRGLQVMDDLESIQIHRRTDARNAQVLLYELKRDWLVMARDKEKAKCRQRSVKVNCCARD
ncbi:hypothetical protein FKP32DRAFT_1560573 [Trametes sanguinea]|nr:hypothetical protein FKP32DRAFT_1560573 [Trametes sanguinea]